MSEYLPSRRLHTFRTGLQMTQEEFASSLGLTKTAYNNYERGIREPKATFWRKVSMVYNVTSDYLLGLSPVKDVAEVHENYLFEDERGLICDYRKLNSLGKETARNSILGLTYIKNYIKVPIDTRIQIGISGDSQIDK